MQQFSNQQFHLMLMRHRKVSMLTSTKAKLMLTDYRNRNKDTWSQHQQRELKYQHYLMQHYLIQGGNQEELDEVDTSSERLTRASMDQILKQLKHDCLQLREYHNASARMKFKLPDSPTNGGGASLLDLEPSGLQKEIADSFLCNVSADDMHLVAIAIKELQSWDETINNPSDSTDNTSVEDQELNMTTLQSVEQKLSKLSEIMNTTKNRFTTCL